MNLFKPALRDINPKYKPNRDLIYSNVSVSTELAQREFISPFQLEIRIGRNNKVDEYHNV